MTLSPFERNCATCRFWGGMRKVASFGTSVEINDMYDDGACCNPDSAVYHLDEYANYFCDKWKSVNE